MKQETFTDIEYSFRKKKTKREEFLEIMDEIIPWDEWVGVIEPYYPSGKRGRPPMGIEKMLRMYLLQIWFNLSDPATEDAIYDSYAMRTFTGIDFMTEAVPDETTLCKFRHLHPVIHRVLLHGPVGFRFGNPLLFHQHGFRAFHDILAFSGPPRQFHAVQL